MKLTGHPYCSKRYSLEHIHQVASIIGRDGADRIDHGLNAVESPELIKSIVEKGIGMTICPWSYIRHQPLDEVFARIRVLFDAGIKIAVASDDPAFMEDTWILENLLVVKKFCRFTNEDIRRLAQYAIEMCWAPEKLKMELLHELRSINIGRTSLPN